MKKLKKKRNSKKIKISNEDEELENEKVEDEEKDNMKVEKKEKRKET